MDRGSFPNLATRQHLPHVSRCPFHWSFSIIMTLSAFLSPSRRYACCSFQTPFYLDVVRFPVARFSPSPPLGVMCFPVARFSPLPLTLTRFSSLPLLGVARSLVTIRFSCFFCQNARESSLNRAPLVPKWLNTWNQRFNIEFQNSLIYASEWKTIFVGMKIMASYGMLNLGKRDVLCNQRSVRKNWSNSSYFFSCRIFHNITSA